MKPACVHCKKPMVIRIIRGVNCACFQCNLIYTPKTHKPLGWLVEIGGKSGGILPFDTIHALAGSDTSPEMIATLIRIAAMKGLQDPSVIQETLQFEAQLARDEVQLH